jgi:hypothetical protein
MSQQRPFRMDLKGFSQRRTLSFTPKPPRPPARTSARAGGAWARATEKMSYELDVLISTVIFGPGREVTDIYYDWARIREIDEDGALPVRPDRHIGWRSMPSDPEQALGQARAPPRPIAGG